MGWKTRNGVDPASAKVSASNLRNVTFGQESYWGGGSGKGIAKSKTGSGPRAKQNAGNMSTKYSQKDATSADIE